MPPVDETTRRAILLSYSHLVSIEETSFGEQGRRRADTGVLDNALPYLTQGVAKPGHGVPRATRCRQAGGDRLLFWRQGLIDRQIRRIHHMRIDPGAPLSLDLAFGVV